MFLIAKWSASRSHYKSKGEIVGPKESAKRFPPSGRSSPRSPSWKSTIFSLNTWLTAVRMSDHFPTMAFAVIAAVCVMLFAAGAGAGPRCRRCASDRQDAGPNYLDLIGVSLIADALHFHTPKAYLYFAVAFSIESPLNLWATARRSDAKRAAAKQTGGIE